MKHGSIRNERLKKIAKGKVKEAVSGDNMIILSPYETVRECYCESCGKWKEVKGVLIYGFCPGCNRPWRETRSFAGMYC